MKRAAYLGHDAAPLFEFLGITIVAPTGGAPSQDTLRRDTDHLVEEHCGVLLMPQDDPDRLGDIGRRQYGGRDLVQERLEQVIIVAVDHGDIDG